MLGIQIMLSAIFIKSNLKHQFFVSISIYSQTISAISQSFKQSKHQIDYSICQIIPSIPSHSRVSRRHQLLSPNPLLLFNSPSPTTAQKPVNFISHICGLGASVECERVERPFNAPRLKAQIWLMKFTGFVCSSLNELNSNKKGVKF